MRRPVYIFFSRLFVFLPFCLFAFLSFCLFVFLSFCLFVFLYFCNFAFLSFLSFCLSVQYSTVQYGTVQYSNRRGWCQGVAHSIFHTMCGVSMTGAASLLAECGTKKISLQKNA